MWEKFKILFQNYICVIDKFECNLLTLLLVGKQFVDLKCSSDICPVLVKILCIYFA